MNFVQKWIKHVNIIFSYFYNSRLNRQTHKQTEIQIYVYKISIIIKDI